MKRKTSLKRFFIYLTLGLGGLLCIAIAAFGYEFIHGWNSYADDYAVEAAVIFQPVPTPGSDLEMLEADAEIKIPASARDIHGMISGFRELDTWARLDLPATDLSDFLQNARCTSPLQPTNPLKYAPSDLDPVFWEPDKATHLEECTGLHDYLFQRVLVDRSEPDLVTIYVFSATDNYTQITTLTPKP